MQKSPTPEWLSEIARIYAEYSLFFQSGGAEQAVFDLRAGTPVKRSHRIISSLRQALALPRTGRYLDVGSGNGETLRAVAQHLPGWSLYGVDLDDRSQDAILQIPGVGGFTPGGIDAVCGRFDLISLIHVAEHVHEIGPLLTALVGRCAPDGSVVFQVPDYAVNPFDLVVADHAFHFSAMSLPHTLSRHGLRPTVVTTDWVPKELSVVATPRPADDCEPALQLPPDDPTLSFARVTAAVSWLYLVRDTARELNRRDLIGVFGTAVAGTWLAAELDERIAFFVDEDPARIGRDYMGHPVLATSEVPEAACVYVCLAPSVAQSVCTRLRSAPGRYIAPPALGV